MYFSLFPLKFALYLTFSDCCFTNYTSILMQQLFSSTLTVELLKDVMHT